MTAVGDGPGTVVGRYRLIRRLGTGSFATVWLGHDDDLDVAVAVKILSPKWAQDDDVRQRFVSEARLMRRINDARITHVYDIGQLADDRPYFVMDFADGGSLNDVRRSHPSPVRALRLCAETCRALAVLHEYDVVHRDVTPGNVLLNRSRTTHNTGTRILIADLGVANDRAAAIGLPMTAGTPGYMSPEQARGEHVDHRSDIYALTALTYAMLTGRPPFGVRTLDDVLGRAADARPEPVAERFGAPELLDTLLAAGLSSDPLLRPPTAGLLGDALDRIANDLAVRLAAQGKAVPSQDSENDEDAVYQGGYEGMATMIRPSSGIGPAPVPEVPTAPASPESLESLSPESLPLESPAEVEPGPEVEPEPEVEPGPEVEPEPEVRPKGVPEAEPRAELASAGAVVATTALPLPLGRYIGLTVTGLMIFTVVVWLTALVLR